MAEIFLLYYRFLAYPKAPDQVLFYRLPRSLWSSYEYGYQIRIMQFVDKWTNKNE